MKRPPIHLHIENLVLHGVPARDRDRAASTIQSHLTKIISERGLPARPAADSPLAAPRVQYAASGSYECIAEAIWRSLEQ